MDASPNHNYRFNLLTQPFRLLQADPAATKEQLVEAFERAVQGRTASIHTLVGARDALLDPMRRLSCELTYPLDCPPSKRETFYTLLREDKSTEELLDFSDSLWPLARANFVAHVASHRPASGELLYALIESHAAIDATDLYEKIKQARSVAGLPAPAFLGVNQAVKGLFDTHAAAALTGYATDRDAADSMLACTLQALASGDRHIIERLGDLLRSYRSAIEGAQIEAVEQLETACAAVEQDPSDSAAQAKIGEGVHFWISVSRPLLVWNADQPANQVEFDVPIETVRVLIARLCEQKQYQAAADVMAITREMFAAAPTTMDQLAEDARIASGLFFYSNIKRLQDLIADGLANPGPLIEALEADTFGAESGEPAQSLWTAFVSATAAISSASSELPWKLLHDLALRLSNSPEAARAVASLLAGLIQHAHNAPLKPAVLKELQNNLNFMQSVIGPDANTMGQAPFPDARRPVSTKSGLFGRLRRSTTDGLRRFKLRRRSYAIGVTVFACLLLSGFAAYQNSDLLRSLLSASGPASSEPTTSSLGSQTKPPVGTGQHLEKDGVRYCYFQQERLRFIKQLAKGPEDARGYNLLIVDYNSRCSDFFYKDEDLNQVKAEVNANRPVLEAEAKKIMSAWPGHDADSLNK